MWTSSRATNALLRHGTRQWAATWENFWIETRSQIVMEDVQTKQLGKGAETTTSFPQRAAELTGFHCNNKEQIERQRGGGEVDLQIKLSSLPAEKALQSHQPLWGGDITVAKPSWLFLLALERNNNKKEREMEEKRKRPSASHSAVSIQISTHISQTAISDFQCPYEKEHF